MHGLSLTLALALSLSLSLTLTLSLSLSLTLTLTLTLTRYMVSLYTTLLGLFSMPWLVFAIPGVGGLLHQMRPTGFDEAGGLKLQMNLQQARSEQ